MTARTAIGINDSVILKKKADSSEVTGYMFATYNAIEKGTCEISANKVTREKYFSLLWVYFQPITRLKAKTGNEILPKYLKSLESKGIKSHPSQPNTSAR